MLDRFKAWRFKRVPRHDAKRSPVGLSLLALSVAWLGWAGVVRPTTANATMQVTCHYGDPQYDRVKTEVGGYRLHAWWRADWCSGGYPGDANYDDTKWPTEYVLGIDSRQCDGCAYDPVDMLSTHARAWRCGTLFYEHTITMNKHYQQGYGAVDGVTVPWTNYFYGRDYAGNAQACNNQADVTVQAQTSRFKDSKYLNEDSTNYAWPYWGNN